MASSELRRAENAPGGWFVDSTCIDCDTCRWMAPEVFDRAGEMSRVHSQPRDAKAEQRAALALVACPTASIGTRSEGVRAAARAFPVALEHQGETLPDVYHCGYHSEASFGATSYLIVRPGGNVLVDSPRYSKVLARRIEQLGGVQSLFFSHRDDVADHARWAEHFGAPRILHAADRSRATQDFEHWLEGEQPIELAEDLRALPVPGHTRGSVCLLYRGELLFTGDHLAWSEPLRQVYAFRSACWYDWDVQRESMARLARESFSWILPGHGRRCHFEPESMRVQLERCLRWMAQPG